jgi:hypothetical protein
MFTGEDLTNLLEDPDRNLLSLCIEKVYYCGAPNTRKQSLVIAVFFITD